jgi:hypothetical protein
VAIIAEDDATPVLYPYWKMSLEAFVAALPADWEAAQLGYLSMVSGEW